MTVEERIEISLNEIQKELVSSYNAKGLRASGKFERDLENFFTETTNGYWFGIKGSDHSEYMENGRRNNADQSPEALKSWVDWAGSTFLKQWVADKGLNISPLAVAWNIAREGIKVPNAYNPGGVISEVITDDLGQRFAKDISFIKVAELESQIRKILE